MKTKLILGSLVLSSFFGMQALAATTNSSLSIHNNNVNIVNAEVTAISGNIVNVVTRFKDIASTWSLTTNASTSISTIGKANGNLSDIQIGDKLNVTGSLTSLGSTFGLTATKILDVTQLQSTSTRAISGTIQTINTVNGTFTLLRDNKTVTVVTNGNTSFKLVPKGSATTTTSLTNLSTTTKVIVTGTLSSDGNTLTATSVIATNANLLKDRKEIKNYIKDIRKEVRDNINLNFGLFKK